MNNLYQTRVITGKRLRKTATQGIRSFSFFTKKEKGIWDYGAISSLTEIMRQRCN